MTTIEEKFLQRGYRPVSLKESDIGKEFLFVFNNMKTRGIFDEFKNPETGLVKIRVSKPIAYNPIRSSNSLNSPNLQSFFTTTLLSTSKGLDEDGNKIGHGHLVFRISDINKKRLEMMNAKKKGNVPTLPDDIIEYMSHYGGKRKTQRRKRKSKTFKNKYKRSKKRQTKKN